MMIWSWIIAIAAVAFRCVVSAPPDANNVVDNHRLFSGKMPHPSVFGLTGYTPLSAVSDHADPDTKWFPDMANAEGTGSFVDYTWQLHGIPSYLYTALKLSKADLEHNNYRIVPSRSVKGDSDAIGNGAYKVVRTGGPAHTLEKRLECGGQDLPPAPPYSPAPTCHADHAATLEDCAPLFFKMKIEWLYCRMYDQNGRVGAMYHSCAFVSQRGRTANTCIAYATIAWNALPIVNKCWPRGGPNACTSWHSGVIEGTDERPKTCACNNESAGKC